MTTLDTLTFIGLYLTASVLIYIFLWAVSELWHRYLEPIISRWLDNWLDGIRNDEAAHRQVQMGEATEEIEAMWRGR